MFDIIRQSLQTGVVTSRYPAAPLEISARARGRPEIDWAGWKDARPAAAACPTGAISYEDRAGRRVVRLDLGQCIFCGLCAGAAPEIRMTNVCECAVRERDDLVTSAGYILKNDGSHERMDAPAAAGNRPGLRPFPAADASFAALGLELKERAAKMFGRSLHIRQVDAGSCNGCEVEINGLNSPVYDIERFGIHFVASPRHADLLLVTGPVRRATWNWRCGKLTTPCPIPGWSWRSAPAVAAAASSAKTTPLAAAWTPSCRWMSIFPAARPIRTRCCRES